MGSEDALTRRRHPWWRLAGIALIGLLGLAVVAGVLVGWTITRSFPTLSGSAKIPGLHQPVTVQRDAAGIPQITAHSAHDLFLAQGYVHAQDRFWEMDFRRHVTSGRLSELFGPSEVSTDAFIRTLGWRRVAEAEVKAMDPTSLSYYQAYADGVNAYLAGRQGADLSLEYAVLGLQHPGYRPEKWTPADSVAWLKAMAWDLRSNLEDEVDRALISAALPAEQVDALHPAYPYDEHPTITSLGGASAGATTPDAGVGGSATSSSPAAAPASSPADGAALAALAGPLRSLRANLDRIPQLLGRSGGDVGSNSWVVSGAHTATGKPLLANDPHLGPAMPSIWYQDALRCAPVSSACPFDVAGFSFSGLPGVVIGHNANIAWGFTNLGADVTDLAIEKTTAAGYEVDGVLKPFTTIHETIGVAGGTSVPITIRATEHGPIVTDASASFAAIAKNLDSTPLGPVPPGHYQLALQWTALTPGHTAESIFLLDAARDWDSFRAAARQFDVPAQNLTYADTRGNIGYQAPGRIPVRKAGDGTLPYPGYSSAYGWSGYVPFDALPSVFNPATGYIVTANNAAVGPDYPVMITRDWDAGYRANQITVRIQQLIDSGTKITVQDMSRIQADRYDANAAVLVPLITRLQLRGGADKAAALLKRWNLRDDGDSAAAAYFNIFWRNLLHDAFGRRLPALAQPVGGDRWFQVVQQAASDPVSPWWIDHKHDILSRDDMFAHVADEAYDEAVRLMGPDLSSWRWDRIHTLELTNQSLGTSGIAPVEWLFNRGPYGLGGASSVVDAVGWDATEGYQVNWVPSMRQVVDLADFDRSTWINLTGQSGHAFHANYDDQAPLWAADRTRAWPFSPPAVSRASSHTLTLTP